MRYALSRLLGLIHWLINKRIFCSGASQGGGLCLAVAGLVPDLSGIMPDVPFLCHF